MCQKYGEIFPTYNLIIFKNMSFKYVQIFISTSTFDKITKVKYMSVTQNSQQSEL